MKKKIKVSVLGATGLIGQNYVKLLLRHPWFELVDLASSARSAGKIYWEAINQKWLLPGLITEKIKNTIVRDASNIDQTKRDVDIVFSAFVALVISLERLEDIGLVILKTKDSVAIL